MRNLVVGFIFSLTLLPSLGFASLSSLFSIPSFFQVSSNLSFLFMFWLSISIWLLFFFFFGTVSSFSMVDLLCISWAILVFHLQLRGKAQVTWLNLLYSLGWDARIFTVKFFWLFCYVTSSLCFLFNWSIVIGRMQRAVQAFSVHGNTVKNAILHRIRVVNPVMRPVMFSRSLTSASMEEHGFESTTISDILKAKGKGADGSWLWCTTDDSVYDAVKSVGIFTISIDSQLCHRILDLPAYLPPICFRWPNTMLVLWWL